MPCMYLAGLGLILSCIVHILSFLNLPFSLDVYRMSVLFLAIFMFIVLVPAVMVMKNLGKNVIKSRDIWKVVLRGCPTWLKYLPNLLFGYALVWFIIITGGNTGGNGSFSINDVKLFSAFIMLFYSGSLAILYSAIQTGGQARRCPNGHPVSPDAKFCGECGLGVINSKSPNNQ